MNKIAFIFPGQASQYVGMAGDIYDEFDQVKELFEKASNILEYDLADVCFNGPEEKLTRTAYTQPAVFAHSCAMNSMLREYGFAPQAAAGHSLGEYSALVCAGAMSFESAMRAIAIRSKAMQQDCNDNPGTMAAVLGLDLERIEAVLKGISGIVVPANLNSPGQVVIAGETAAVNDACERLKEAGAKRAMPIPVGGAYHSPLMNNSSKIVARYINEELAISDFDCPVYSNVSACSISDPAEYKSLLSRQISSPVLWYPIVENMYRDGVRSFVEIGPGKVLQGLVKKTLKDGDAEIIGVDTLEQFDNFLKEKMVSA